MIQNGNGISIFIPIVLEILMSFSFFFLFLVFEGHLYSSLSGTEAFPEHVPAEGTDEKETSFYEAGN